MHPMAPARAAELQECPLWLTTAPPAAIEVHGPGRSSICAVRHTAGETSMPGIACACIQLHADAHEMPACLLMLADAAEPGPRDRRRACKGTAGSQYRSMAGPSGQPGEVAGNPIKPGSASDPK
jgi:hypothetical protein